MIKEVILKDFPTWDSERQLSEYQGYKALGDYSPFNESDYELMEMVMNNPNAAVECENGICSIVNESIDLSKVDDTLEHLESNVVDCMDKLEEAVTALKNYNK